MLLRGFHQGEHEPIDDRLREVQFFEGYDPANTHLYEVGYSNMVSMTMMTAYQLKINYDGTILPESYQEEMLVNIEELGRQIIRYESLPKTIYSLSKMSLFKATPSEVSKAFREEMAKDVKEGMREAVDRLEKPIEENLPMEVEINFDFPEWEYYRKL